MCGHGRVGGSRSPARQCVATTLVLALAAVAAAALHPPLCNDGAAGGASDSLVLVLVVDQLTDKDLRFFHAGGVLGCILTPTSSLALRGPRFPSRYSLESPGVCVRSAV